ncbi:MAG: hypothetical protein HC886_03450 [Leptolyngbyaceae cyanobacterium SM1_1_3]|nr:hypothetical protein [Leptolyngbyaceae cyanobacterium SM1_1_3]
MKYHGSVAGIAAIATTAVLAASSAASAATLSQQSVSLLSLDPTNSQYASSYSSIVDAYNSQAASHSLAFEDWFAINSFVNNEQAAYGSSGAKLNELVALDLNNLSWKADAQNVEVFFINEGAGYRNKFGYSTASPTAVGNEGLLAFWNDQVTTIWSDIASQNSIISESNGPLTLGQGYTIGDVAAGNTINFLLRNPQNKVFDSLSAANTKTAMAYSMSQPISMVSTWC